MKVLTFSRYYPKGHPKAGQPTFFIERILNSFHNGQMSLDNIGHELKELVNDFELIANENQKHHTIRAGSRFKPGDMASLRIWSDKPYRSKQIEFAQVEVKKVWPVTIIADDIFNPIYSGDILIPTCALAKNDGLECDDFVKWFMIHPKKTGAIFTGQIICWSDSIEYGKPSLLTESTINEEQELADKFSALLKERTELDLKRGCGVSLDKNEYIGDRQAEIEKEIKQLKKPKS